MAKSWIFQGNPGRFDVMGYLSHVGVGESFLWTASRYRSEFEVGDNVYIWISGKDSGIVASAVVEGIPQVLAEDDYVKSQFEVGEPLKHETWRVPLRLEKIANKKQVVKREWLLDDPGCQNMQILKMANGTNFRLDAEEESRLSILWEKTGVAWGESECVAAIYLYEEIWKGKLSKKSGSPVADTAMLIGRAVSSVYNKILNIRYLDPRVGTKGFSGGGRAIEDAWNRYFNAEEKLLDTESLGTDFRHHWGQFADLPRLSDTYNSFESDVNDCLNKTPEELMALIDGEQRPPAKTKNQTYVYKRCEKVKALGLKRAGFKCEMPNCDYKPFYKTDGRPFVEVHHIKRLADNGLDIPGNIICLCPNHHREAHYGESANELISLMKSVRAAEA